MQTRSLLKLLSVFLIVIAVLMVVLSILTMTGGTMLSSLGLQATPETPDDQATQEMVFGFGVMAIVFGVIILLVGIFELCTGILGFRGAQGNPRSAGKAKVMGAIAMVFVVLINGHTILNNPSFGTICSAIVGISIQYSFVWSAHKVQMENGALTDA